MSFTSDNPLQSNQLPISMEFPEVLDSEFKNTLEDNLKRIANVTNSKVGGLYTLQEVAAFRQYFKYDAAPPGGNPVPQQFRSIYRKVFDMVRLNGGNIAPAATVNFPHGITGLAAATWIYASCHNTGGQFFSLVFPDVWLTSTNVFLTNSSATPLDQAYVIAEYSKQAF
jgi:hypothetical protein